MYFYWDDQIGPIAARVCLAVYLNGLRSTMLTTIVKRYVVLNELKTEGLF